MAILVGFICFVVVEHIESGTGRSQFPQTKPSSLPIGAIAPGFSLSRLGGGSTVSLATGHGEPVMVNFFASWCTDCRQELRAVAQVAVATSGKLAVIGVDTSDTNPQTAERLLAKAGATYPVGEDPRASTAAKYKITGLPVTFFLSSSRRIEGVAFGPQTRASLERWARRLTARATSP